MTPLSILYKAFKENRVKQISNKMYEVDDKIVTIQTKQGRQLITCSCFNHTKWCNSPAFCYHKEMILVYPIFEYYKNKIDELVSFMKINKGMGKNKIGEEDIIKMIEDVCKLT